MKSRIKKLLASFKNQSGFGLLEVIVAMALFMIVIVAGSGGVLQTYSINTLSGTETQAKLYAQEGIEAVHSIAKQDFANIAVGTYGLNPSSGSWVFSGTTETLGDYTRRIQVQEVQRDGSGNIVASGGTVDPDMYRIVSIVNWSLSPTRNNTVDLVTYVSNYRQDITTGGNTMASNVEADYSAANWPNNRRDLRDFYLTNIGETTVTIASMSVEWFTNSNNSLNSIEFDNSSVWTGGDTSIVSADITDWDIAAGVTQENILGFSGAMNSETNVTIVYTFTDASTKEVIIGGIIVGLLLILTVFLIFSARKHAYATK